MEGSVDHKGCEEEWVGFGLPGCGKGRVEKRHQGVVGVEEGRDKGPVT